MSKLTIDEAIGIMERHSRLAQIINNNELMFQYGTIANMLREWKEELKSKNKSCATCDYTRMVCSGCINLSNWQSKWEEGR